jgi:uncharacterized protein YegL
MGNYSKLWSSKEPGYIIFLVDQSGSMAENYGGKNKAEFASLVINRTINEIILANMDGDKVKDRVFISIIGYGGKGNNSIEDIRSDYLSSYADKPLRVEVLKKMVSDGAGGLVEIEDELPIIIEPIANGLTPMGEAFKFAKELIEGWVQRKPNNPAPVIINVSDGLPTDDEIGLSSEEKSISVANEIMSLSTEDGNPLIFNAHLGSSSLKYAFDEDANKINDNQAKFLFQISSELPEEYKKAAIKHNFLCKEKSRCFVSNAEPETFIKFINFGSSGGTDRIG